MLTSENVTENIDKFVIEFVKSVSAGTFVKLTLGNYRGGEEHLQKLSVRPVATKKGVKLQFEHRYQRRDAAKNHDLEEGGRLIRESLETGFRSGHLFTTSNDFELTIGKKNSRLMSKQPTVKTLPAMSHDREKERLIDPTAHYLHALGITTKQGEVRAQQQGKWRQINKYVETMRSLLERSTLRDATRLRIVDMGSGKGYLTFAAYDYFANVAGLEVVMTGVDSNQQLVDLGNTVAIESGFKGLNVVHGDIASFEIGEVDILIALHACDTATDDALYRGIKAQAAIIVAAPCCHKEVRQQMSPPEILANILKHGSMLEREAETITDGLRAMLLERHGYSTKVFEFVPVEHTPKNNMIAAVMAKAESGQAERLQQQIDAIKAFYGIRTQHLENLLA